MIQWQPRFRNDQEVMCLSVMCEAESHQAIRIRPAPSLIKWEGGKEEIKRELWKFKEIMILAIITEIVIAGYTVITYHIMTLQTYVLDHTPRMMRARWSCHFWTVRYNYKK